MATVVPMNTGDKSIRIADFDFDLDKDGKTDEFEKKVLQALQAADTDGSGTLTPAEMVTVLRGMAESQKENKRLGKQVTFLSILTVLLIVALTGVATVGAMLGGETIKESKVPDCSDPSTPEEEDMCAPGNTVSTSSVQSYYPAIFDLASAPTEQLAEMKELTTYVDMTTGPAGGAVEATFKVAGAIKSSATTASLFTTNGFTIALDSDAQTGELTMNGATYPVLEEMPAEGRRLNTEDTQMVGTLTGKQLAKHHLERRRKLNFAGALMTSGSFTMMAASGLD